VQFITWYLSPAILFLNWILKLWSNKNKIQKQAKCGARFENSAFQYQAKNIRRLCEESKKFWEELIVYFPFTTNCVFDATSKSIKQLFKLDFYRTWIAHTCKQFEVVKLLPEPNQWEQGAPQEDENGCRTGKALWDASLSHAPLGTVYLFCCMLISNELYLYSVHCFIWHLHTYFCECVVR
jgi:hypothetical protein